MNHPTLLLSPLQDGVPAAGGHVDVLVRLRAPAQAAIAQPAMPKRLALVIDRSGSMDGPPLTEALRCAQHIATHLSPIDQLSLLVYDHEVDVLLPLQTPPAEAQISAMLAQVHSGGSTDLHGGWLAGAQQLEGGSAQAVSRVILLSDGQANHGLTDSAQIAAQCRDWLSRGVSTSTVGLGRSFNEQLMVEMARAGGGQTYYGQTATDLFDGFDEELALLQAMCLHRIRLRLIAPPGVVLEMLSPIVADAQGQWPLDDLAWGSERWLAVRLHLAPGSVGPLRDVLAATAEGLDAQGQAVQTSAGLLQLPALDAAELAQRAQDPGVHDRLQEVAFAQAADALRAVARRGDAQATQAALRELEARFGEHPWLRAKIEHLRHLAEQDIEIMAKEVHYSSERMSRRLAALQESRYEADETQSQEMPAFLRKKLSEGRGRSS